MNTVTTNTKDRHLSKKDTLHIAYLIYNLLIGRAIHLTLKLLLHLSVPHYNSIITFSSSFIQDIFFNI